MVAEFYGRETHTVSRVILFSMVTSLMTITVNLALLRQFWWRSFRCRPLSATGQKPARAWQNNWSADPPAS